jgi:hypothetical protein
MRRGGLEQLCALALVGASANGVSGAQEKISSPNVSQFVGSVGCKSSYCHGGGGESKGQYLTWVQRDYHTRAYAILVSARSTRMAEALGLEDGDASKSEKCTVCHSPMRTLPPAELSSLTSKGSLDDAVSCENCHGAAANWQRSHTRHDWTYSMRVGAGMRDLRNLYVRANTCVACHQNVRLNVREAGHPLLTFELDRQSVQEPRHWPQEDLLSGPRAWLVGQAVALREVSWALADSKRAQRDDPQLAAQWNALAWLLAKITANQTQLGAVSPPVENPDATVASNTQEQANALARQATALRWDQTRVSSALQTMTATQPEFQHLATFPPELAYQRALRLVLALNCLDWAAEHGSPSTGATEALRVLWEDVRNSANFQPAQFAADLATFCATMKGGPQ